MPRLRELTLHNGTIYRWNRPVYEVVDGVPHLRVENRVMPAGPTVADVIANAAFYYGLVRALAEAPRPVWHRLPFGAAAANFDAACRDGIGAVLHWPRPRGTALTEVPAADLIRDELLPLAVRRAGLLGHRPRRPGPATSASSRSAAGAVPTARNGRPRPSTGCWSGGLDRRAALAAMTQRYRSHSFEGDPVHTWPAP